MATATLQTGKDGELDGTHVVDLDAFFHGESASNDPLLVYFHGGLVNHTDGVAAAQTVSDAFNGGSTLSVVWRTGPFEVIHNNLNEAIREKLFQDLTVKVLGWAVGKLSDISGAKSGPTFTPAPASRLFHNGDYADFSELEDRAVGAPMLTAAEQAEFEASVLADPEIQSDVLAIAWGAEIDTAETHAKSIESEPQATRSRIDRAVLDHLRASSGPDRSKGILPGWAWFAKRTASILFRVVERIVKGRHHGTYPTVIEEIAREFYLTAAGHFLWKTIKTEAKDTFEHPDRGGSLLAARLHAIRIARPDKPVIAVGHSAGSVYVCGLLDRLSELSPAVQVDVAFLAPAVTTTRFAATLERAGSHIGQFRMFTMDDAHECADRCLGIAYPRSLLYLVSGAAEDEVDAPLLGLARHVRTPRFDDTATVITRAYLLADLTNRVVWSVEDRGPGLASSATAHGDFNKDPLTLRSVGHLAGLQY